MSNEKIESILRQHDLPDGAPPRYTDSTRCEAHNGNCLSRSSVNLSSDLNRYSRTPTSNSTDIYHYDFQFEKTKEIKKLHHRFLSALDIHQKNWFFKRDHNINRLHTNFTNTSSELRELVILKGCDTGLVEIDISNSQPLFLAALVKNKFTEGYNIPADVHRFIGLTESGGLYDYFTTDTISRASAKDNIIKYIFGESGYENYNEVNASFVAKYPTIAQYIQETKERDYRNTSKILQREESRFVIDKFCQVLIDKYPELNFYTVHDSIIAPREFSDIIQQEMIDLFKSMYDLQMGLKVTTLS